MLDTRCSPVRAMTTSRMYGCMYAPAIKPPCEVGLIIIISMFHVCLLSSAMCIGEKIGSCGCHFAKYVRYYSCLSRISWAIVSTPLSEFILRPHCGVHSTSCKLGYCFHPITSVPFRSSKFTEFSYVDVIMVLSLMLPHYVTLIELLFPPHY